LSVRGNPVRTAKFVKWSIASSISWIVIMVFACSNPVDKKDAKPQLSLVSDTTVSIMDSLHLAVHAKASGGMAVGYVWWLDARRLSSTDSACCLIFGINDTGVHEVIVTGTSAGNQSSTPETAMVTVVVLNPPRISVLHDTTVAINDTLIFHAVRVDTFSTVVRWVWARNGAAFSDTTLAASLSVRFGRNETGENRILVKAVDSRGAESNIDSVHVFVVLDPPVVSIVHDTMVLINDPVVFHAHGTDTNGYIVKYIWTRGGTTIFDTTAADSFAQTFSRADTGKQIVIRVTAVDNDTLESNTDSARVTVRLKPSPSVSISHDTSVFINDSITILAQGKASASNSPIVTYVWALDKTIFDDSTKTSMLVLRFPRSDTGKHVLRVKDIDRDTMESSVDSMVIQVFLGAPRVKGMADTAVFINDTSVLHASGTDTNGVVTRYIWAFDQAKFVDTTTGGLIKKAWSIQDTGRHVVKIKVQDDDTVQSTADSFDVRVRLGMPVINAIHDTAVPWNDTITETIAAHDTNGTIQRYLWTSGDGTGAWNDSSATDTLRLTSNIHCRTRVVVGARDDDGLVARDTFFVDFKAVRCSLSVQGLKTPDTEIVNPFISKKVNTMLTFSAFRGDGMADTFTYSFSSGLSPLALVETYRGTSSACTLKTLDSGTYYWKCTAFDSHDDTVSTPISSLCIMPQRRICFVGHSIITGMGSTSGHGGLRRMIVDTLRANAGQSKKIGCEGPLTVPVLYSVLPAEDDSCLAVGGNTCGAIYDSMRIYGSTNADMWVYMNGVNDWYSFPTNYYKYGSGNYAVMSIDSMHARNPQSEIYVFNGLPFPKDTGFGFSHTLDSAFTKNLPVFNRMLDSTIKSRCLAWQGSGQGGVWLVDAFTPMSNPDSHSNPVYFAPNDFLHPNQQGYDLMTRELFKVMRAAKSSFIK
jgi:hypothetical protein